MSDRFGHRGGSMDCFVASLLAMTIEGPCAPSLSLRAQAKQSIFAPKRKVDCFVASLPCANAPPVVAGNNVARVVPAEAGTHTPCRSCREMLFDDFPAN